MIASISTGPDTPSRVSRAGVDTEGAAVGRLERMLQGIDPVWVAVGLFVLMPLLVAQGGVTLLFGEVDSGLESFLVHILEGFVRIGVFIGYLALVSRSAEIGRVFQYHGAEHMTIHTLEANLPLQVENVRKFPTAHPRCGTEFLVIFILVSILLFSLLAGVELWVAILGRILLVPVIAAVSYEVLKFGAARREKGFWRLLFLPGIWVQRITTKQPEDDMIEIAICAMQEGLAANGDTAPAGSWDPPREPMPDVNELAKEMEARHEAEEAAAAETAADGAPDAAGPAEADGPADAAAEPEDVSAEAADGTDVPATRAGGATESA